MKDQVAKEVDIAGMEVQVAAKVKEVVDMDMASIEEYGAVHGGQETAWSLRIKRRVLSCSQDGPVINKPLI
ncbi:hypothetical protein, partial [Oceanidesulfovibrio marinus]